MPLSCDHALRNCDVLSFGRNKSSFSVLTFKLHTQLCNWYRDPWDNNGWSTNCFLRQTQGNKGAILRLVHTDLNPAGDNHSIQHITLDQTLCNACQGKIFIHFHELTSLFGGSGSCHFLAVLLPKFIPTPQDRCTYRVWEVQRGWAINLE